MNDTKMTNGLAQTWVTVTDGRGRTRLEAHWTANSDDRAPMHAAHVTHAA